MGEIVEHVGFRRMRLAPGCVVRANVAALAEGGRAGVPPWDRVPRLHEDPVRYAIVDVTTVVVSVRWERSGEGIDPRARADRVLIAIQPRPIGIRASRA